MRPTRFVVHRAVVVMLAALCWSLTPAPRAVAAPPVVTPVDEGAATIVDANNPTKALRSGDGDTAFTFQFPAGFACPGDSMHDNWRFQTFMVPVTADVTTLDYGVIGPTGENQYALFAADASARSFAQVLTQANVVAGQPGLVAALPPLSFAVVAGEALPAGSYRIGYACTFFGQTASYWHAEVVVTATSDDFAWRLAGTPATDDPDDGTATWIVPTVLALVVATAACFLLFRRRRRTPRSPKEST
jgi:hypothetical protein